MSTEPLSPEEWEKVRTFGIHPELTPLRRRVRRLWSDTTGIRRGALAVLAAVVLAVPAFIVGVVLVVVWAVKGDK